MKSRIISRIAVGLLAFGLVQPTQIHALTVRSADIAAADGTSGQVLTTGNGVKTGHIQGGAVTGAKIATGAVDDSKITGPISASKINTSGLNADMVDGKHAADFQAKYSNVVVVAKSGGDFTDPVAALSSIVDASSTNPYLVKIMPGVYDIGTSTVQMKQWVDIEGSGVGVTEITGSKALSFSDGTVNGADNSELRALTVRNNVGTPVANLYASPRISQVAVISAGGDTAVGISNGYSAPTLTDVSITVSGGAVFGLVNSQSATISRRVNISATSSGGWDCYGVYGCGALVDQVTISATGAGNIYGLYSLNAGTPVVTNSTVTVSGSGWAIGVKVESGSMSMSNVNIAAFSGNVSIGIQVVAGGAASVSDVTAKGSGGASNHGMWMADGSAVIDRSTFEGSTSSISADSGDVVRIGGSKLAGGTSGGTFTCIHSYDGNFVALNPSCQ